MNLQRDGTKISQDNNKPRLTPKTRIQKHTGSAPLPIHIDGVWAGSHMMLNRDKLQPSFMLRSISRKQRRKLGKGTELGLTG